LPYIFAIALPFVLLSASFLSRPTNVDERLLALAALLADELAGVDLLDHDDDVATAGLSRS
jgi:hypothetical protein